MFCPIISGRDLFPVVPSILQVSHLTFVCLVLLLVVANLGSEKSNSQASKLADHTTIIQVSYRRITIVEQESIKYSNLLP